MSAGAGVSGAGGSGESGSGPTLPAAGSQVVLRAEGLGKRFGSREALRDVSFAARAGEMVAVIGPNGAGKTTLLSLLGGVQIPSSGAVVRSGEAVGWAPQQPALYSKLTVSENLRLFARLERVADPEAAVARMLEQTGLADRAAERVQRLSGGNRQRVNVALALLADPPAILLDEPSSALDPGQRERLWSFVGRCAAQGTCVVFSTHIVAEAARYAARVLVLDEGELLFDGPPGELVERGRGARRAGGSPEAGGGAPEAGGGAPEGGGTPRGGGADFEAAFVSFLRKRP